MSETFEGIFEWDWEDSVLLTGDPDPEKKYCFVVGELEKYHGKKIRVIIEELEKEKSYD